MKYTGSIFFIILLLAILTGGCQQHEKIMTPKEIFDQEFTAVYEQQNAMRKTQILQELQKEYRNAVTLSNMGSLELLLENYELSETEKKYAMLNYFDRALLYMQISLFPVERDKFLSKHIRNTLMYETASVFLQISVTENYLAKSLTLTPSNEVRIFQNQLLNAIDDRKIEYAALRINDLDAIKNIPKLEYPLNEIPAFKNLEEFRLTGSHTSALFDLTLSLYSELNKQYGDTMPLILIKMLYKSPSSLIQLYYNDPEMKKDFCLLLSELVHFYQAEQLFNAMQNSFSIRSDMQHAVNNTANLSVQMLDAGIKSELTYQLAYLKMLSHLGKSNFSSVIIDNQKVKQISPARAATLKLLFYDILNSIK